MSNIHLYLSILLISILTISCSDDSPVNGGETEEEPPPASSQYIIASSSTASEGVADYLLTTDDLTEGTISTVGNGIEQDGTWRYYVTDHAQTKFFSFLYSNSGAVTTYQLNDSGELEEIADFQSSIVHAFAPVDDDILSMQIPRDGEPTAHWYRLNTESVQFVDEGQINTEELAPGNERAYFSWLKQVGNRVFAPYASIKGCCNDNFGTQYPDSAWVAVFDYPSMELETVIKDDRTSFIGKYMVNGLAVDESGDAYAFSSALADNNGEFVTTKPSAITRINSGELEFDQDYFFNLEEASGGYFVTNHVYASDGNVILFMGGPEKSSVYAVGTRLAVINLYDKSFTWVTGLPDPEDITEMMRRNNYASEDGSTVYTGITIGTTTENGEGEEEVVVEGSYVYAIDVASATATRGLEVEGGKITAIHKLKNPE